MRRRAYPELAATDRLDEACGKVRIWRRDFVFDSRSPAAVRLLNFDIGSEAVDDEHRA